MARSVLSLVGVMVLLGDEELSDRLVLKENPALRVQKEVVLEALRDQDVPRLFLGCRRRRIGCRQPEPLPSLRGSVGLTRQAVKSRRVQRISALHLFGIITGIRGGAAVATTDTRG